MTTIKDLEQAKQIKDEETSSFIGIEVRLAKLKRAAKKAETKGKIEKNRNAAVNLISDTEKKIKSVAVNSSFIPFVKKKKLKELKLTREHAVTILRDLHKKNKDAENSTFDNIKGSLSKISKFMGVKLLAIKLGIDQDFAGADFKDILLKIPDKQVNELDTSIPSDPEADPKEDNKYLNSGEYEEKKDPALKEKGKSKKTDADNENKESKDKKSDGTVAKKYGDTIIKTEDAKSPEVIDSDQASTIQNIQNIDNSVQNVEKIDVSNVDSIQNNIVNNELKTTKENNQIIVEQVINEMRKTSDISKEIVQNIVTKLSTYKKVNKEFVTQIINNLGENKNNVTNELIHKLVQQAEKGESPKKLKGPKGKSDVVNSKRPDQKSKIKVGSGEQNKTTESLKVKSNPDTDTPEDVKETNQRIVDYLVTKGEIDIAEHISKSFSKTNETSNKKVSEIIQNTEEVKKLSVVNEEIREILEEMQEDMHDEQDTSINLPTKQVKAPKMFGSDGSVGGDGSDGSGTIIDTVLGALGGLVGLAATKKLADKLRGKKGVDKLNGKDTKKDVKSNRELKKTSTTKKDIPEKSTKVSPDSGKQNTKDINKGKAAAKKLEKGVDDATKKGPETKADAKGKKVTKVSKGAGKGVVRKLTRFLKPIPVIGTAIAAGSAIYSAADGWNNAPEIMGKDESKLTVGDKIASAAGGVANDISFGWVSASKTAKKLVGLFSDVQEDENGNPIDPDKVTAGETAVPDKTITDTIDAQSAQRAKTAVQEKIDVNTANIEVLKKEYSKAQKEDNEQKIKKIQDVVIQKEKEIQELKDIVDGKKEVPIVIKDKKIQEVETMNTKIVNNTKNYDRSKTIHNVMPQGTSTVVGINSNNQQSNNSAFGLFENL